MHHLFFHLSVVRAALLGTATTLATAVAPHASAGPHFASGVKVGETSAAGAIVWVRLTRDAAVDPLVAADDGRMPTHAVPGAAGQARIRFAPAGSGGDAPPPAAWCETPWQPIEEATDFTHQFVLGGLQPATTYAFEARARDGADDPSPTRITGRFRTAPDASVRAPVRFAAASCQAMRSADSDAGGHRTYHRLAAFAPDFFIHTGDILYYDRAPLAKNVAEARSKWNLMFAYGDNRAFHRHVGTYFMKDDHDTLKNDCWPGQTYGELTFEQGLDLFREQVPMGERTFRTQRWGRDLQVWMIEGRDFRTPNREPDGPDKTLLGVEQKAWLLKSVAASDATFRFVVFPGPLVGPDKPRKNDNHANPAFAHEGAELRRFLAGQPNTYVICGDRHWQYCSVDPQTGLTELGTGAINDRHTYGGRPQKDPAYHQYFAPRGGFLGVTVAGDTATAQWISGGAPDADTGELEVLHTEVFHADR